MSVGLWLIGRGFEEKQGEPPASLWPIESSLVPSHAELMSPDDVLQPIQLQKPVGCGTNASLTAEKPGTHDQAGKTETDGEPP